MYGGLWTYSLSKQYKWIRNFPICQIWDASDHEECQYFTITAETIASLTMPPEKATHIQKKNGVSCLYLLIAVEALGIYLRNIMGYIFS